MRVLTIFVRTGTTKYATAEQELAEVFQTQLPGVERNTIVVDTTLPSCQVERSPHRVVIGGDNSVREFSAFDSGVAHAGEDIWNYDLVNLTTAAFRQLYWDYLERFLPDVLAAVAGRPACLGHIDCYNHPIEVGGCRSQHWVRTACMFLPPTELKILGSLVSTRRREEWFSGDPAAPFRPDAPLSDAYKKLITDWLIGNDIGQGVKWHTRIALDEENLPEFERKAMAILNEHLFGLRLRAAACRTIDVTWLSGRLASQRPETIDWDTPWWRQLAARDRHALNVNTAAPIAS
jgi:hypothetical protein